MKNTQTNRIGLFLDDGRVSGVSIFTKNLAEYINKNIRVPCQIIIPKKNSNIILKQIVKKKIPYKLYDIEKISKSTILDYFKFVLFKKRLLFNFFKKNLYQIYIIQGSLQILNILVLNYLNKKQILIIHDSHNSLIFKFLLKLLIKKETKIIFVSEK